MSGIIKLGLSIRLQLFDWKSPLFSSVYWSLAELLWSNYVFLITERCLVGLHYGPFMRRSTWLTLLAASHDIWLFTNEWLMAERGLSVADLAFYHEWPSIFDSEQEPWNQAHFFTPGNRLSDCGVNRKKLLCLHATLTSEQTCNCWLNREG